MTDWNAKITSANVELFARLNQELRSQYKEPVGSIDQVVGNLHDISKL